jgi:hypothetical protein
MALIANNISGSIANQSRIGITGSVVVANVRGAVFPSLPGNDTTFFVSGSTAAGRSNVSVFGGGVVISGSLTQGNFLSGGATGQFAMANGDSAIASGNSSHAEGVGTAASGDNSHAEGASTIASGEGSHAEGSATMSSGDYSHAEGLQALASGLYSHAEGYLTTGSGDYSHAEGYASIASGTYSHAEGLLTLATGSNSHAEGQQTIAAAAASHAEGYLTATTGLFSHAEGQETRASGNGSHAEGYNTTASGFASHAEGGSIFIGGIGGTTYYVTASGQYSHAEGAGTKAFGQGSHAEGFLSTTLGSGSHAEGYNTKAEGDYSHTSGFGTVASGSYQTVIGKYNIGDSSTNTLFIVGDGTSDVARANALKVTTTTADFDVEANFNSAADFDQGTTAATSGSSGVSETTFPIRLRYRSGTNYYTWAIGIDSGLDLNFSYGSIALTPPPTLGAKGRLQNNVDVGTIDFTGQHRCIPDGLVTDYTNKIGMIVKSTGEIAPLSGSMMSINDAIPVISLTSARNDKSCFGVISEVEDEESSDRTYKQGVWVTVYEKKSETDNRVYVNSLGEGCIWVCNINGNLENGDYITTCEIPGYGMKQDDDLLHNYTVAKITMDCSFDLNNDKYRCEEFVHEETTYRRAFVACTYHCG